MKSFEDEVDAAIKAINGMPDNVLLEAMKERGYTCYDFDTHNDVWLEIQINECVNRINESGNIPKVKRI